MKLMIARSVAIFCVPVVVRLLTSIGLQTFVLQKLNGKGQRRADWKITTMPECLKANPDLEVPQKADVFRSHMFGTSTFLPALKTAIQDHRPISSEA